MTSTTASLVRFSCAASPNTTKITVKMTQIIDVTKFPSVENIKLRNLTALLSLSMKRDHHRASGCSGMIAMLQASRFDINIAQMNVTREEAGESHHDYRS